MLGSADGRATSQWVPSRVAWLVALIALAAVALAACRVGVGDLEKWRNRRGSEQKFVDWMLDPEASDEVRAKAIDMLFEQYGCTGCEGATYLPRVADLPPERRDQAIRDALPHIVELYQGAEFSLGGDATGRLRPVQVRDGAIMLYDATDNPDVRAQIIDQIVARWLREQYSPCITSVGRHPNSRILSMVGQERGLPVVVGVIRAGTIDDIICQDSYLSDVTWLPAAADLLATAYTARYDSAPPDTPDNQRYFVAAMVRLPESQVLKNWIFDHILSSETPLLTDVVDAFLDYVRPLSDASDSPRYVAMISQFDGYIRWIGFENVVRLRGADGLDAALAAIPDAGVWGRWGDEVVDDGLKRAAEWVCDRPELTALGADGRAVLERHLQDNNLVARAIAIECLGALGNDDTVALLQPLTQADTAIPSWGTENNTVGAVAQDVIDRIHNGGSPPATP
jgi:hypothetical protein